MDTRGSSQSVQPALPAFAARPVIVVAAAVVAVLLALSSRYGYHRDELYFLLAGQHPAAGYVDQPPLTPVLARIAGDLFPATPTGLRVIPAFVTAGTITLTALLAREFGSGRAGQLLAALCAACSGYVLATGHMLATNTVDLAAWLAFILLTLRLLRTGDGRYWPALGAVAGIALLNKYLIVLLAVALLVGVLAVGPRRVLRSPWVAAGLLIAVLIALPNLLWQASHGWPQLTVARGISEDGSRLLFVPLQLVQLSPLLIPIWIAGIRRLLRTPELRWARPLLVAYPVLCALVLAAGGKSYYALPLLLPLVAAGCEPVAQLARYGRPLLIAAVTSAVVALPVLPASALSLINALNPDQSEEVGWPELVRATAVGWAAIPAADRARAVIVTGNYGEAGAIARYGPARGLPIPYSGHMSLADWGPPPASADGPVLVLEKRGWTGVSDRFTDCRTITEVDNDPGTPNQEQHTLVRLCSGPHAPWPTLWPSLRILH